MATETKQQDIVQIRDEAISYIQPYLDAESDPDSRRHIGRMVGLTFAMAHAPIVVLEALACRLEQMGQHGFAQRLDQVVEEFGNEASAENTDGYVN